jgi:ParB family chromosome partitioning protein
VSSLKNKAKAIRFPMHVEPSTNEEGADQATEQRTKTAPGQMMSLANDRRSELLQENEALKKRVEAVAVVEQRLVEVQDELKQWDGVKGAKLIDPAEIGRSKFANRHERSFEDSDFAVLRAEIENAGGNIQPIKVRPVKQLEESPIKYEIIFGHRRHEACRQAGVPVLAIVDNLDDQTLFVEMDRENRARKNLSAYEQGTMYKRALDQGLFPSAKRMSVAIGVDLAQIGKAISLAELPPEVVAAFTNPLDIQFRWAKPLRDALEVRGEQVLRIAAHIINTNPRPVAVDVFNALLKIDEGGRTVPPQSQSLETAKVIVTRKGDRTVIDVNSRLSDANQKKLVEFIELLVK